MGYGRKHFGTRGDVATEFWGKRIRSDVVFHLKIPRVENGRTDSVPRKRLGRKKIVDEKELLIQEQAWIFAFRGLRDGLPESEADVPGGRGSAMLIKTKDERGCRRLHAFRSDREPRTFNLRFATEPNEIHEWCKNAEQEERGVDELAAGRKAVTVRQSAISSERPLFDALMRAKTPAQVRRICRRSKYWLKYGWDFARGGFFETFSACPRALYEHAEEFCRAKLDARYPARDNRASGDFRRIKYLARVDRIE